MERRFASGALDPAGAGRPARWRQRELGIRLIIVYKFLKALIMLAVAVWLSAATGSVYRTADFLAHVLAEGGPAGAHAGAWLSAHLTSKLVVEAALVAWLDTVVTAGEGILLWSGRAWGEWVVIAVLAGLLPVEVFSLLHRPSPGKWPLLGVNTAMVVYLVRRRLHCAAEAGKDGPSSNCAPRSRR